MFVDSYTYKLIVSGYLLMLCTKIWASNWEICTFKNGMNDRFQEITWHSKSSVP